VAQGHPEGLIDSLRAAFARRLAAARAGEGRALGDLLEAFRAPLLRVARMRIPDGLRAKCDGTDLVQETMLEAHRCFADFNGSAAEDLGAWLRRILEHHVVDLERRYHASKRSIEREQSLEAAQEAGVLWAGPADPEPSPFSQLVALERTKRHHAALWLLSDDERTAIEMRRFEHLPFEQIGDRLNRSADAARKLLARAEQKLRRVLDLMGGTGF